MPLIPAGDLVRQLTLMMGDRNAVNDSGTDYRAPSRPGSTAAAERERAAEAPVAAPPFRGWQDHRPAFCLPDRPLTGAQVRAVVASAYAADRCAWAHMGRDDPAVVVMIEAARVTHLRRGLYTAGPTGKTVFEPLPGAAQSPDVSREYGSAPALLHVCGDLVAACQRGGSGYSALLVRAGALGEAAWLAAVSAGLAGATYARSSYRVTEAVRPLGQGLRHLLTVAIGLGPAAGTESPAEG